MKGKKFDWLPVILLSLVAQFFILQFLLFIEIKLLHAMSYELLVKINFFVIALSGGLVAMRYYIKSSPHIGGICGALFIILSEFYSRHFSIDLTVIFVMLIAYLAGYIGSILQTNNSLFKRT
ncbi:hypothetical protein HMPREF1210_02958 [Paenisporosarcina sp. HGH0030]|uniref:hypothetical protein n=1 Tax=Paenisporosarcina sp. HGH0030 TaxID=1078085 RepID=UPI00034ECE46|nr:hypothetical protein [Paenisporosarcina sp. HGH0030]EPD50110.1 hypothetical protein HMPREF1210_02958 [Paenisporosarcina sp. HGH0030]